MGAPPSHETTHDPHQGRAIDTLNFRNVKESQSSMDLGHGSTGGLTLDPGKVNGHSIGGKSLGASSSEAGGGGGGEAAATIGKGGLSKDGLLGVPASGLKGVPLDSGLATPGGEMVDPFEDFNSVTLHHAGDAEGAGAGRAA